MESPQGFVEQIDPNELCFYEVMKVEVPVEFIDSHKTFGQYHFG